MRGEISYLAERGAAEKCRIIAEKGIKRAEAVTAGHRGLCREAMKVMAAATAIMPKSAGLIVSLHGGGSGPCSIAARRKKYQGREAAWAQMI